MKKQVRETKDGKNIDAYIVLNASGEMVATIHVWYGGSEVWADVFTDREGLCFQGRGRSLTEALRGAIVDGHTLPDDCEELGQWDMSDPNVETHGGRYYSNDFAIPQGYKASGYLFKVDGFSSCYKYAGLKFLEALGYRVIQAI